jgi:hypothetical protein
VRGTAHQVIERYVQMASDAQLAGDHVAAENCLQHIEHYVRRLEAAKRAEDARREEQAEQTCARQAELAAEKSARTQRLFEASEAYGKAL